VGYEEVAKLALERCFFFPAAEIYGDALAGFWEYGPLGVSLKNRVVELWRREMVRRDGMLEVDGSVILPERVFAASGHLRGFADPVVECLRCGSVHRADKLIEQIIGALVPEKLSEKELDGLLEKNQARCPKCGGQLSKTRRFNMMFKLGVGAREAAPAYLRPETCQSIFLDFPRVFRTMRCKLPAALAQVGRSFRNEISPRQGLIRLREMIQAEIEIFFNPAKAGDYHKFRLVEDCELSIQPLDSSERKPFSCKQAVKEGLIANELIAYYMALLQQFYDKTGIPGSEMRYREMGAEERAFYAEQGWDLEVRTSLGWLELVACNYRTDYDLRGHARESGRDLAIMDEGKVLPHVFELSMGIDRTVYSIMEHSLTREKERLVLKVPPYLAPIQVAVFPLVNRKGLPDEAKRIHNMLRTSFDVFYDDSGSIGRRYRRQDEVGTPCCVTVDYQTMEDKTVTVRDRDTMLQDRTGVDAILGHIREKVSFPSG